MGMPKLHYPKQPWFSSIAVLTSFVNESPLENRGGFAATQLFLFGSESTTKSKTCFGHAFWKKQSKNQQTCSRPCFGYTSNIFTFFNVKNNRNHIY
jgi:collagenase-like PrtC family protease